MKQIKFIFFFTLSLLFVGCQSEEVVNPSANVADEIQMEEQMNQAFDAMLSEDQKAVIARLEAINDSIAESAKASDIPETRELAEIDWSGVAAADARGFAAGWRHGLKNGKGLGGKLTMGAINGVLFGICYSACEYTYQRTGKRECILVTLVLGQRAIYTEMAYRWENGDADALAQLMVSEDPNLLTQGTYEDLKLSVLHNAVILNHEDGVLLPSGPAENLYSPEQIAWLNSDEVQKHYNSIPTVLSSETGTYVSPMFMPYESRIASAYVTGLRQLGQLSVSQTYVSSRDLCKEYTKVVQEDSGVSEETVGNLISTFYMGPVSAKCWKTHLGY